MIKLQTGHFEPFFLYYDNVFSPQVFWIVTSQLKFGVEEPVRKFTVMHNYELLGDVSAQFEKDTMFRSPGPE